MQQLQRGLVDLLCPGRVACAPGRDAKVLQDDDARPGRDFSGRRVENAGAFGREVEPASVVPHIERDRREAAQALGRAQGVASRSRHGERFLDERCRPLEIAPELRVEGHLR